MSKPSGFDQVQRAPVFAHSRMMLPVFGGISGSDSTTWNMVSRRRACLRTRELAEQLGEPCASSGPVAVADRAAIDRVTAASSPIVPVQNISSAR